MDMPVLIETIQRSECLVDNGKNLSFVSSNHLPQVHRLRPVTRSVNAGRLRKFFTSYASWQVYTGFAQDF